ncbi:ATP-binding protein [Streptomyces sp. NBC_01481]|uniref:ATP-binding protein n=1 Tax=Streptomyces sp. NBC_01481 TaxID=2975869 RepID=UPI00224DCA06|nr:ATP-binding protein [Streptomyces sp. NBC_01481]MCX4587405.1 ATP-binding protein [Streptomyces sp. NBC_01481]
MHVTAACRYTLEVQASTERIPQIRRILAAHLRYWSLEDHIAPVCRAVDELVGNVVHHVKGDKTCVVELRWTGRHLIASVADKDRRMPRVTSSSPKKGGLATVAVLSDSWGTCGTATGKVIWFSRRVKEVQRVLRTAPVSMPPVREFKPLPRSLAFPEDEVPAVPAKVREPDRAVAPAGVG